MNSKLPRHVHKGRGATLSPANRYADTACEDIDDGWGSLEEPLPGPVRLAYERPGTHTYELYEGGQKVDTVTTNLVSGRATVLQSVVALREFTTSIGLRLVKVRDLLGPGKDGWVGKSEVTQAEYQKVMGANPSKYPGPDLPVDNVTWLQAVEFCRKLSQLETRHPPGPPGQYGLPSLVEWKRFAANADLKAAVIGQDHPARVGSKGTDAMGLFDVLGNVREWLAGTDPRNKNFIGGGFRSRRSFGGMRAFVDPQQLQLDQSSDDLGFRVIWIPER